MPHLSAPKRMRIDETEKKITNAINNNIEELMAAKLIHAGEKLRLLQAPEDVEGALARSSGGIRTDSRGASEIKKATLNRLKRQKRSGTEKPEDETNEDGVVVSESEDGEAVLADARDRKRKRREEELAKLLSESGGVKRAKTDPVARQLLEEKRRIRALREMEGLPVSSDSELDSDADGSDDNSDD